MINVHYILSYLLCFSFTCVFQILKESKCINSANRVPQFRCSLADGKRWQKCIDKQRNEIFEVFVKARSHGAVFSECDCDQKMECCMRFSDFVHMVRWVWMRFPMSLHWNAHRIHWNRTSQLHRIGMEPIHVRHRTHQCIARTWNRTIWTPS